MGSQTRNGDGSGRLIALSFGTSQGIQWIGECMELTAGQASTS
jgi:hypothetical protein